MRRRQKPGEKDGGAKKKKKRWGGGRRVGHASLRLQTVPNRPPRMEVVLGEEARNDR